MSFLDRFITSGGELLSAAARALYLAATETSRRKNSPLCFDEDLTESDFVAMARDIAKRTPRVGHVVVTGMTVTIRVASISGLSSWEAEIDYNDYGRLTGAYWLTTENSESLIPEHFANALKEQIARRVSQAT